MTITLNPIGVISMFYARPFTKEHFSTFERMKKAGADVIELLVPEPGELDCRCRSNLRFGGPREFDARSRKP
jgi:D-psicose/D-tagatose/L-ribulose 3-epimerase